MVVASSGSSSGICSLSLRLPDGSASTAAFSASASARWGAFSPVSQGTYTATATGCNGSWSSRDFFFSTASVVSLSICATHPVYGTSCSDASPAPEGDTIRTGYAQVVSFSHHSTNELGAYLALKVEGEVVSVSGGPNGWTSTYQNSVARSRYFSVTNTTTTTQDADIALTGVVHQSPGPNNYEAVVSFSSGLAGGGVIVGTVSIAELGQSFTVADASGSFVGRISGLAIAALTASAQQLLSAWRQGLALFGVPHSISGSDFVLVDVGTMTFTAADTSAQPALSTTTLAVYAWTGSSWTSSGITQLGVAKDTTTSVATASATVTRSGTFAMLCEVTDASAPITSWAVDGSSSYFQGTTFLSTYSYIVLSATDPVVDGFHSGLATTYYRVDGLPGDAFSAYSSSLSFIPGTHWVDAYSVDWAGNPESVSRATITVTAGSVTKLSSDLQVDGNLLVGFLGSGAKAEVVARAEYDYALMVSSTDGRAMLAVDNANFASIGTAPASGRLTLQGVAGDTTLALRSGNSTAAVTGAQLAFGFDGTGELRHGVYTQHGSAAGNNKVVFALWSPDSSSSSLAGVPVLSLEGSAIAAGGLVHVRPYGTADAELEVSNGVTTGGGYILRGEALTPSSARFKKDIQRLTRKDEEQAYKDVAALKPAMFRRKHITKDGVASSDPSAPLERGLIFEETPKSVRGRPGEIFLDERLVNAELALKAAMRRIEELSARLERLKEQGR
ncbi:MAG: hypothetical protein HY928_06485 [Elusimicrobia bacterium]|nr:hypothetical protein [Elusimicrobiota bacterium]